MKKPFKPIYNKLTDLLTGGNNPKVRKIYRKIIDTIVIGLLWLVIFVLYVILAAIVKKLLFFAYGRPERFFLLLLVIPGRLLTNKYRIYVDKIRQHRDSEPSGKPFERQPPDSE